MNEQKLAKASYSFVTTYGGTTNWSPEDVDKLESRDLEKFSEVIGDCRFYYQKDPIAATVINKMVEIGITDIKFIKNSLSVNEFRIFDGIKDELRAFIESCALEYLISGLVVPEVKYAAVSKKQLESFGVKKYESLTIPVKMWLRDPTTIKIKDLMMDSPSYYVVVPEDLVFFIENNGKYPDGSEDKKLFAELLKYYPEFVAQVKSGVREFLLDNDKIIRRKAITGSAYPTPYLFPVLEALKHKRNIRRMDYSIASRVIEAIQLIQLGNDEYPVLEGEEAAFEDLKKEMAWKYSSGRNMERIFQLFANHTLQITWVYPDVQALLNERKYLEVNQDIFFGLGFPRILTTGETERTQTSNSEFAMISPRKSMENLQKQMLKILKIMVYEICTLNGFRDVPEVSFERINLDAISEFVGMVSTLLDKNAISYTTFSDIFGYNFDEEMEQRKKDQKIIDEINPQDEMFTNNPVKTDKVTTNKDSNSKETPKN